jgi:hypothetical protein
LEVLGLLDQLEALAFLQALLEQLERQQVRLLEQLLELELVLGQQQVLRLERQLALEQQRERQQGLE